MSISTEFIDFIVPIETIRQKYPGGWEQCLKDHENLINGRVWFDDYLIRDGAMGPRQRRHGGPGSHHRPAQRKRR